MFDVCWHFGILISVCQVTSFIYFFSRTSIYLFFEMVANSIWVISRQYRPSFIDHSFVWLQVSGIRYILIPLISHIFKMVEWMANNLIRMWCFHSLSNYSTIKHFRIAFANHNRLMTIPHRVKNDHLAFWPF